MNMDYVFTNEFGQQIISNDPKKGIPTTGKYRFKFRWQNEQGLQSSFLKADFLVPNVKNMVGHYPMMIHLQIISHLFTTTPQFQLGKHQETRYHFLLILVWPF